MKRLTFHRASVDRLLLLVSALLAAFIYADAIRKDTPVGADQLPSDSGEPVAAAIAPFVLPPRDNFAEMVERPLFSRSRRAPAGLPTDTVSVDPSLRLALTGVILAGDRSVGLLQRLEGSGGLRLTVGQSHEDWTVREITAKHIVFTQEERSLEIRLRQQAPPLQERRAEKELAAPESPAEQHDPIQSP